MVCGVLEWADAAGQLELVRGPLFPDFEPIPPAAKFDVKALEIYAAKLPPYLIGLLPKRLLLQRSLRMNEQSELVQESLRRSEPARNALIDVLSEFLSNSTEKVA